MVDFARGIITAGWSSLLLSLCAGLTTGARAVNLNGVTGFGIKVGIIDTGDCPVFRRGAGPEFSKRARSAHPRAGGTLPARTLSQRWVLTACSCVLHDSFHASGAPPGVDYTHPALGGCLGTGCRVAYGHNYIQNNGDPRDTCIGVHVLLLMFSNTVLRRLSNQLLHSRCLSGATSLRTAGRGSLLFLPLPGVAFVAVGAVPMFLSVLLPTTDKPRHRAAQSCGRQAC